MRTKCNRMDLIRNLNLWGNDLHNIGVLRHMPNLEVLSLSVNRVSSLEALRSCPKLTELYLRKNEIRDLAEVQHLTGLRQLRVLWMNDNPCASLGHYRDFVLQLLPGLSKLDSQDITEDERRRAARADFSDVPTHACSYDDSPQMSEPTDEASVGGSSPWAAPRVRRRSEVSLGGASRLSAEFQPEYLGRGYSAPPDVHGADEDDADFGPPFERRPAPAEFPVSRATSAEFPVSRAASAGGRFPLSQETSPSMRGDFTAMLPDQVSRERLPSTMAFDDRSGDRSPEACLSPRSETRYSGQESPMERPPGDMGLPMDAIPAHGSSTPHAMYGGADDCGRLRSASDCGVPVFGGCPQPTVAGDATAARRCEALQRDWKAGCDAESEHHGSAPGGGNTSGEPARADNILCAVLALIKELDRQGLELVRRAIEQRRCEL